ncbi:DEAD/DEAH box helicase [Halobacillus trueperi]|uniref:Helicase conserved C-terminal domain-containing protein n=2 Tax=Halobacillus TaxID=45667 RepID=A0A1H0JNZ0_HALAD|nr:MULTISPECIES: SNF2-related protein [Halobacillus]RDY70749.1 DEAD/DEAH box helicase [Halobacillus trueperi]SDO45314.1 Helicase conserved C-terminal domain-containing protein [Halobacillus aidingensis]
MIEIHPDQSFIGLLSENLEHPDKLATWDGFKLAYQAAQFKTVPEFDGLLALEHLPHVDFMEHQIEAAETAVHQMNGRAILADEVGLGKTLEAGLILKEYMIRGRAKKILILTPASLVNQWIQELNEKFYIQAASPRKKQASWKEWDVTVTSIDMAKRENHREVILDIDYDLIIIDEAHKLKNHQTKNYQFVQSLKKTYCLLLTATPIQNKLSDLFNLVSILKPGYLGNLTDFKKKYKENAADKDNIQHIHSLVGHLMIRNRRKDTGLDSSKRKVVNERLSFSDEEMEMYKKLEQLKANHPSFTWLTLAKELCSSREACYMSLNQLKKNAPEEKADVYDEYIEAIGQVPHHVKAKRMTELIEKTGEKFIVFTEYRATQFYLQWYLQQNGITSVPFSGKFNKSKRDWMKQLFKNKAQVMIATEAGGEGINLQFCHHMINYDLPWNPMRLEQRIGRIHRFGQEHDVKIFNFAIKDTIEDHIMKMLYEKIEMFKNAVGDLDHILEQIPGGSFEHQIQSIIKQSESQGEVDIKLNNLVSYVEHTVNERRESS